jgi:hypothetical protein
MMNVLSSVFQVFVMVVLFSIGALEMVSNRTVNKPLAWDYYNKEWEIYEHKAVSKELFQEEHWKIVLSPKFDKFPIRGV